MAPLNPDNSCPHLGICGSCTLYEIPYPDQLLWKQSRLQEMFGGLYDHSIEVFSSSPVHFRDRAEFRVFHQDGQVHYAMHTAQKKLTPITVCPIVNRSISDLMPRLLKIIQPDPVLRERLYTVEFLSGDEITLVTLIYHKPLDSHWEQHACQLTEKLPIRLIGRSRKQKIVLESDRVSRTLEVDGSSYTYTTGEDSFSQPNGQMNQNMIQWMTQRLPKGIDLLELYCGIGNFTIPFSRSAHQILATEISKSSLALAKENAHANHQNNITFIRLSADETRQALDGVRTFNRLRGIDVATFDFQAVFVDPPRAGVDSETLEFIRRFPLIFYISCNPNTLLENTTALSATHHITDMALFDQFPHTCHMECGAVLQKR